MAPALLTQDAASTARPVERERHVFAIEDAAPSKITLRPFFAQYEQRTAVYFPLIERAEWTIRERAHAASERERKDVERRTIDLLQPTNTAQERAHGMKTKDTEIWSYAGRGMQMAWWTPGSFVEASLKVNKGPNVLRVLYWGEDVGQDFLIEVNGRLLAREKRAAPPIKQFVAVEYPLSQHLTSGGETVRVRFTSAGSAASVYELRVVEPA